MRLTAPIPRPERTLTGAAKLNLKILEIPVRYADRSYGETQISRFAHGWLLARMVLFAYKKLKAL